jgi:hypothetical protein
MNCAQRIQELEDRLKQLEQHLLPAPPYQTTGTYTDRQLDQTRAYRLLAHAEIEACIEDLARGVAVDVHLAWLADRRPRAPVLALLAYCEKVHGLPPESLPLAGPADIAQRVEAAKNIFTARIHSNDGVRERNVLSLLMPIGLTEYDISQTWLATIDSFGHQRGDTAHQSLKRAKFLPDPATEVATVADILGGIKDIGTVLDNLQAT